MKVFVATVGVGGERFDLEEVGTYSTRERALEEANRVDRETAEVKEVEIDRTADWATDEALAENRRAEGRA